MKKQLMSILFITGIALVFWSFKLANTGESETNRAVKLKSLAPAGSFASLLRDTNVAVKKKPVVHPMDKGVGPVKELKLSPINHQLAKVGQGIFTAKCVVCHSLDQKIIGPPLRNVTKRRSPEYIMNMILNPTGMEKEDPIVKVLHKSYIATPMTDQGFTQSQARSLLEYLRTVEK
jgi:mono/diheme cytochrome c family protein